MIPDYKTSVFMNDLFRTIKENKNLDLLEESDDEEDDNDCDETDAKSDLVDNDSDNISVGSELDEEKYDYSDEDE